MILATFILTLGGLIFLLCSQMVMFAPFVACFATLLWLYMFAAGWRRMLKSGIFWAFLAFLVLVAGQIFNSGAVTVDADGLLDIAPPVFGWYPFVLGKNIAIMTLINWYAIAGLFVAAELDEIRSSKRQIENFVIMSAVILAVLGVAQYYTGATAIFWTSSLPHRPAFFSVFQYVNNASTFFLIAGAIALGRSWRYLPVFALGVFCAWIVNARFALICFGFILLYKILRENRLWIVGVLFGVGCCVGVNILVAERWHEYVINLELLKHNPLFGIGINGHAVILESYLENIPPYITDLFRGQPNAHCDPLIFAVEYGLVGVGILGFIVLKSISGALKSRGVTCAILAVFFALCHSCIDMPLRNPVILALIAIVLIREQARPK